VLGRVCRDCNKVFERSDARKKHEWNSHGLEDSKPIRRTSNDSAIR
jgi:hypothetical protein